MVKVGGLVLPRNKVKKLTKANRLTAIRHGVIGNTFTAG